MPTVFTTNCTMSVSVIDHMPPRTLYSTTMPPPMITPRDFGSPKRTLKMVEYAIVDVTVSIRVYAIITRPEMVLELPP